MSIWLCLAFLLLGFMAIFIEIFVPAGGMIGLGGFVLMLISVVFAYKDYGNLAGTLMLLLVVVGTPAAVLGAFKVFPKTYIGKRLILQQSQQQEDGYTSYTSEKYADLLGREGTTLTMLRPSGMARFDDRKFSVVTEGELIQPGRKIKVTAVEGSRIVVTSAEESEGSA